MNCKRLILKALTLMILFSSFTGCNNHLSDSNVDVEIFLPYLSENKSDSSKAISSTTTGSSYFFYISLTHENGKNINLNGQSGQTVRTGKISTGEWSITIDALLGDNVLYSAATKLLLKTGETQTLVFSFTKTNGNSGTSGDIPLYGGKANVNFNDETFIRVDVSELNVDLNDINNNYLTDASLKLYDANQNIVSSIKVPSNIYEAENKIASLPVSLSIGTYTISLFQGTRRKLISKTITVYPISTITSVYIPNSSESYASNKLPVVINGTNLNSMDFDSTLLTISGDITELSDITVIDDSKMTASIICPSNENSEEKSITISYDNKFTASTTFYVYDDSKCSYNIGDFILNDGTKIDYTDDITLTDEEKEKVIAIVGAKLYGGGTIIAAGLNLSDSLRLEKNHGNFSYKGLTSTSTKESSSYNISGDLQGADNLEYFLSQDQNGITDFETYYPAFYYADNYGKELSGVYNTNWYIPSIYELSEIMNNVSILEKARIAAGKSSFNRNKSYKKSNSGTTSAQYNYYLYHYIYSNSYADDSNIWYVTVSDNSSSGAPTYSIGKFDSTCMVPQDTTNFKELSYDTDLTTIYNSQEFSGDGFVGYYAAGMSRNYYCYTIKVLPVHIVPIQ